MRFNGIIKNDFSAGPGVCVSVFVQGCPHRCPGCHNPETWEFGAGKEFTMEDLNEIIEDLSANGINRSLAIMGGEPLCQENTFLTLLLAKTVKEKKPDTKIYIWTGYTLEDLKESVQWPKVEQILEYTDILVDGPFIESERDITLPMRGSRNQRILKKEIDF